VPRIEARERVAVLVADCRADDSEVVTVARAVTEAVNDVRRDDSL